jgi:hypothetical protein
MSKQSLIGSGAVVSAALNEAMQVIEKLLLETVKSNAPVGATGEFVGSLESRLVGAGVGSVGGLIQAEVYSTEEIPLMEFLLYGTAAHDEGVDGKFLYNPDEGFAAMGVVEHPGYAPEDFATPSLQQVDEKAQGILIEAIRTAILL